MMTKSEMAVETLSRDQVSAFYKIVREELEKENVTWDMLVGRTYIAPVRRAKYIIVWRLREELNLKKITIAHLIELDATTVRIILKTMSETKGDLPDNLKLKPKNTEAKEQRI